MNGEYIERLQSIVSNKLHNEVEKAKSTESMVDRLSQTSQASQTNLEVNSKADQSSNAEMMVVPLMPEKDIQPHSSIAKVPAKSLAQQQRPVTNLKPEMHSETVHIASASSSRQQEFDSIETSLAKITCSQRAICSSMNSIV